MNIFKDSINSIPGLLGIKESKKRKKLIQFLSTSTHLHPTSALTYPLFPANVFSKTFFTSLRKKWKSQKRNKKLKLQF